MCCDKEINETPQQANQQPSISDFVLYAERRVILGHSAHVEGGAVGVHAVAEPAFGVQLRIGSESRLDRARDVYSPSVSLGRDVELGVIQANSIDDDGVAIGCPVSYPAAAMPPLPLASIEPCRGDGRSVAAGQVEVFLPGSYGAVTVHGILLLIPGTYCFSSLAMTNGARMIAMAGGVHLNIQQILTAGRSVTIYSAFHKPADQFMIAVAGSDSDAAYPAVSLGEYSTIRCLLAAPHGTIAFADRVRATGAFAGFDIAAGEHLHVAFENGFAPNAAGQQGSQALTGYYGVHPDPSVAPLAGPVPPDTNISLAIGLPVRNPSGLKNLIQQVSDPKSPDFRKHITQAQFAATYGATAADYAALHDWVTSRGLTVAATYSNNLLMTVNGTAELIGQALYVNLVFRLRPDGSKFVAVDRDPSIDLSVPILQISGLADFRTPAPAVTLNGTGSGGNYRAADLRNAYLGVSSPNQSLDGTGQVVGIVDFATFQTSDITAYDALQVPAQGQPARPAANITIVATEGGNPAPNSAIEATLDIALVRAIAPGAQILFFQGSTGITGHLDDILHAMATSSPPLTVATCSLSFGRSDNSQQALDQMAAQGVSFFTASGDSGDIGDPQSNQDMNNQTLVGGTFLSTQPRTGGAYPSNYYAGETTWVGTNFGSGGGVMDGNNKNGNCYCWPYNLGPFSCCGSGVSIPDYQRAIMQASAAANGGSTQWRDYPDVAMLAANAEIIFQAKTNIVSGTSLAAPLWAGYLALVNQRSLQSGGGLAGFLNPTLYDIGLTRGTSNDLYSICFNDIQDGASNFDGFGPGFKSVPGYDLATGLGSPTGALINQLASPTPLTPNQPLALIRFVITTGDDDLGGGLHGSSATADIFVPGGGSFTVKLRDSSEPNWDPHTTHTVDFPIPNSVNPPLTQSNGVTGVRINLVQNNPDVSADNWDITALAVSLFNPPFSAGTAVCQLNLVGHNTLQDGSTGLVRLSKSAGSSGNGPSSPIFATGSGSGCP
jgi:Pro-kumamolisin, activation domain/Subtilase family